MYFHAKEQALEYAYAVLRYHSSEKLVISFILTYLKNLTLLCGFPCKEKKNSTQHTWRLLSVDLYNGSPS